MSSLLGSLKKENFNDMKKRGGIHNSELKDELSLLASNTLSVSASFYDSQVLIGSFHTGIC